MKTNLDFNKNDEVVLRPRFQIEIDSSKAKVLNLFESVNFKENELIIKRVADHVFIQFPKEQQELWTPQLELEVNKIDEDSCKIYGLYGPKPSVWLFFMFLHFMVALAFIAFCIWAYTNWTLKTSFIIPVVLAVFMVFIWFFLYFIGRMGKSKSIDEMAILHNFMNSILAKID